MKSRLSISALPASLLALVSLATATQIGPTAVRKLSLDEGEKLFPEHLAFAPLELPIIADANSIPADTTGYYRRAFAPHHDASENDVLRRAAKALALLERRSSCPSEMNSCANIGAPNKCCQEGTYCVEVDDESVGEVACCPQGSQCGGNVGACPEDAVSCPASLGGGCCIAGFVCQGSGCIRSELVTRSETSTEPAVSTTQASTITSTRTTVIQGQPSTVIVTLTVTHEPVEPTTITTTEVVTQSATGRPPWRPTTDPGSAVTSGPPSPTSDTSESTQEGCPTGFYGCLANHGGGCCRTDRNCEVHSCPATSTTIFSDGVTIVVPAGDVPATTPATCADGWFLCGRDAGPVAGCCPTGFDCGTASCFTVEASQTQQVQKIFPESASGRAVWGWYAVVVGLTVSTMTIL
ncbi:hypothetical protein B0I35DRAFT_126173 [Stachybotrys elegans]|uniref:GPI anchored protein n=1 Tax=Stachybotrys elegans TaxID=80388 RepID=A0A8K0WUX3_9HYPO|nr:hypothetical protein B0I35DRAFT_126173 [Stachybotrys elegans]